MLNQRAVYLMELMNMKPHTFISTRRLRTQCRSSSPYLTHKLITPQLNRNMKFQNSKQNNNKTNTNNSLHLSQTCDEPPANPPGFTAIFSTSIHLCTHCSQWSLCSTDSLILVFKYQTELHFHSRIRCCQTQDLPMFCLPKQHQASVDKWTITPHTPITSNPISNSDSYSSPTERNASPTITMVFHVIFHLTTTDQTTGEHCVTTLAALPICPRCPLLNCQLFHSMTGPIILIIPLLYNVKIIILIPQFRVNKGHNLKEWMNDPRRMFVYVLYCNNVSVKSCLLCTTWRDYPQKRTCR